MESRGLQPGDRPQDIGPLYLVTFVGNFPTFRWAEFQAAADYWDVRYCFVELPKVDGTGDASQTASTSTRQPAILDDARPHALVHLANDDVARKLTSRVTCIKSICEQWASATSLQGVRARLRDDVETRKVWLPYVTSDVAWRGNVSSYRRTLNAAEKRERIEAFSDVLDFQGPIRLRDPEVEFYYAEEWTRARKLTQEEKDRSDVDLGLYVPAVDEEGREDPQCQVLLGVHVGRLVAGKDNGVFARDLITQLDVKKRAYIGNTTMESGMSLVQAGMALAGPGNLVYDPFAGTGSLLLAAAAYGAHVVGSDIDPRTLKGKCTDDRSTPGFALSAQQYGLQHLFIDTLCFDFTQHPLRCGQLFDAIVTDPPYGIRAGARRLGRRATHEIAEVPFLCPDGVYAHAKDDYVPPSRPYALDDLLSDLLPFAAHMLKPRGRLVFWLPTMTDVEDGDAKKGSTSLQELQLPRSRDFRLVAHSLQDFGMWGRRLITLEKVERVSDDNDDEDVESAPHNLRLPPAPEHHTQRALEAAKTDNAAQNRRVMATDNPDEFRNLYFSGRRKKKDVAVAGESGD